MRVFTMLAATLCLSLAASFADAAEVNKTMAAGSVLNMNGYFNLNEDCSSVGYATVRITGAPTHGRVKVYRGTSYPSFVSPNPRTVCNVRKAPSTNLDYTPERGFVGTDYMTVEVIFPNGFDRSDSYTINVK